MNRKETIQYMLSLAGEGTAVLTSSTIHEDIPTIHDISRRDGARLRSGGEVRHVGFGVFIGTAPNGTEFSFMGGGALSRSDEPFDEGQISWCILAPSAGSRGSAAEMYESMGYDLPAAAALKSLLAEEG